MNHPITEETEDSSRDCESNTAGEDVKRIVVIGAGTMGSQIAMVAALSGYDTTLVDIAEDRLREAQNNLRERLERQVDRGRRKRSQVDRAFARLATAVDLNSAAADADLVIEAASEDVTLKRSLFQQLDKVCRDHTILVTNSSNIIPSQIADSTARPSKVCNMHFFNPALVMECVEIIPHEGTDEETVGAVVNVAESFGKEPVRLHREVPGFVANRLLNALRREALDLYQTGVADFRDIDRAARSALRHPMGPFELMDLVGIDVVYLIRQAEYEQTGDPASLPSEVVTELYEAGHYGRKTGRGWYTYE